MTRCRPCLILHRAQFALLLRLVSGQTPTTPSVIPYGVIELGRTAFALVAGLVGRPVPKLDLLARQVHQCGHSAIYLLAAGSGGLAFFSLTHPDIRLQYLPYLSFMLSLPYGVIHLWRHTAVRERALCMILPKAFHGIL